MKLKLLRKDGTVIEYEVNDGLIWFVLALAGMISLVSLNTK